MVVINKGTSTIDFSWKRVVKAKIILLHLPLQNICRQEEVGNHTSLSSCRGNIGSSCPRRMEIGELPFHITGNPVTIYLSENCTHFHGFFQETCSKVYPLQRREHGYNHQRGEVYHTQ